MKPKNRRKFKQLGRQRNRPNCQKDEIRFGDNLPKTRSGKFMRRLLRSLAKGEEITSDISTLDGPAILEELKRLSKHSGMNYINLFGLAYKILIRRNRPNLIKIKMFYLSAGRSTINY